MEKEIEINIKSGDENHKNVFKGKDRLKKAIHFIKTDAIAILKDQHKEDD